MEKESEITSNPKIERCPECKSPNFVHDYDSGETICADCGLVIREQILNKGPEWNAWEISQKSRVGIPTNFAVHDKGLSTSVGGGPFGIDYDAFGRKLPIETRRQMWRLRNWQIRSRVDKSVDRNLVKAFSELNRISNKYKIPISVKERAAVIYRKALKKGIIVRGRSIVAMIVASLYVACRINGIPRTLQELSDAISISEGPKAGKNEIARCYRLIVKEIDFTMPAPNPINLIEKIANRARISGETQGLAIRILHLAKEKRLQQGRDPMGFAAAALYIACLQNYERKTQKEIAEAAGVTEVTIRNRYKNLEDQLGLEIPKNPINDSIRAKNFALFYFDKKTN